jgi:hypothetical protein
MKQVSITRDIAARPKAVWRVLTDPDALTRDTGITRFNGALADGQRIILQAEVSEERTFNLVVTEFDAPRRMVWSSGVGRVFRSERVFTLTPQGDGTRFEMTERFSGLLLPFIWRTMPDLNPSFEQFAQAIAAQAEGASAPA